MARECKYRLPCGWCEKFDVMCKFSEYELNKPIECNHDWEYIKSDTCDGTYYTYTYRCRSCGEIKTETVNIREKQQ